MIPRRFVVRPSCLSPFAFFLCVLAATLAARAGDAPGGAPAPVRGAGCLSCHAGIEPSHPDVPGAPACADCHRGNPAIRFDGDAAGYLADRGRLEREAAIRRYRRDFRRDLEAVAERAAAAALLAAPPRELAAVLSLEALGRLRLYALSERGRPGAPAMTRVAEALDEAERLLAAGSPPPGARSAAAERIAAALDEDDPRGSGRRHFSASTGAAARQIADGFRTGALPDGRAKIPDGATPETLERLSLLAEAMRARGRAFGALEGGLAEASKAFEAARPGLLERRRLALDLQRALETDDPRFALRGARGPVPDPPSDLPFAAIARAAADRERRDAGLWQRVLRAERGFFDAERQAHDGLVKRAGAPEEAARACGTCHREEVERVARSPHATAAGIVLAGRHAAGLPRAGAFGAQPEAVGAGGRFLAPPPPAGDWRQILTTIEGRSRDLLSKGCLSCHVGADTRVPAGDRTVSGEATAAGAHRLAGCAACHMPVAESGGHRGGDPALPAAESDAALSPFQSIFRAHPADHRMVRRASSEACLACHHCEWSVGPGFEGLVERSAPARVPGAARRFGRDFERTLPDVHRERGMDCLDCHTMREAHGSGSVASRAGEEAEVRCASCHAAPGADPSPPPGLAVRKEAGGWVLRGAAGRPDRAIPATSRDVPAHRIRPHMEKLECAACHAVSAPAREPPPPILRLLGSDPTRPRGAITPEDSRAQWSYLDRVSTPWRWVFPPAPVRPGPPVLGWNARGRLAPTIPAPPPPEPPPPPPGAPAPPAPAAPARSAWIPFAAHTIREEARSCGSCHGDRSAFEPASGAPPSHVEGCRGLTKDEIDGLQAIEWMTPRR